MLEGATGRRRSPWLTSVAVPPLHPGGPGPGGGDDDPLDDDDLDDTGFRAPLPPEDRLWRHPSELSALDPAATEPSRPGRPAALVLGAGVAGALLATAGMFAAGAFDVRVVERVAAPAEDVRAGVPAAVEAASRSVAAVTVQRADGQAVGSAVAVRGDGHLVTDAALVDGARTVRVVVHGGSGHDADVVGLDPLTGVAVLRVDAAGLAPARLGTSSSLRSGAEAVVVGARGGDGWRASVQTTSVSAVAPRIEGADGTARYGMIVVDAPFRPGSAGAALVAADGTVVGVAAGMAGPGAGGVATPIELVLHVADQLISRGEARHVWLGLHGSDAPAGGAVVDDVVAGGPADRAGLVAGDVVRAVDGEPVRSMASLIVALRLHLPGDVVVLAVERGGERRDVRVDLGSRQR